MLFLEHSYSYWGAAEVFRASLGKNRNEHNLSAYHPPSSLNASAVAPSICGEDTPHLHHCPEREFDLR